MSAETLANLLKEDRRFEPPAELAAEANVKAAAYEEAAADREAFWARAAERLSWSQRWERVLDESNPPFFKWFTGGRLNAAYNCVDRHVEAGRGEKVAIHWVGEPEDDTRDLTYAQLQEEVCKAANALTGLATAVSAHGPLVGRVSPFAIRGAGSGSTPKRHAFATAAEVAQLADLVPPDMRIVVLLAAWCGMRAGEIQALRRSDIDLKADPPVIRIRRSYDPHAQAFKEPKSEAAIRDQHIPEHLLEPLRAHLKPVVTGPDGLLFPSRLNAGHPISRDTWNGRLKCVTCGKKATACAAAQRASKGTAGHVGKHGFEPQMNGWYAARSAIGRDDLHLHDLRAAGATQLARLGYQVSEIQSWLGDSTPEAALRYIRATDDRKARMAADLSRIASGFAGPPDEA